MKKKGRAAQRNRHRSFHTPASTLPSVCFVAVPSANVVFPLVPFTFLWAIIGCKESANLMAWHVPNTVQCEPATFNSFTLSSIPCTFQYLLLHCNHPHGRRRAHHPHSHQPGIKYTNCVNDQAHCKRAYASIACIKNIRTCAHNDK